MSPKNTHKSEIRVDLKCPPTSVRFNTLKSNTCEICGIRVSPKNTHKSEIRVSLKCPPTSVRFPTIKSKTCEICGIRVSPKNTTKRDSCEEKGSEGGVGTTSFGAFP